jgi:hypothetical protein
MPGRIGLTLLAVFLVGVLVLSSNSIGSPPAVSLRTAREPLHATPELGPVKPSLVESNPAQVSPVYLVTFTASGLPAGTVWSLGFNGTVNMTSKTTMTYMMPNGSYIYSVGPAVADGTTYTTSPQSAALHITGASKSRTLDFVPVSAVSALWTITFTESGLASGDAWSVNLNGTALFTSGNTLVFPVSNGSFVFGVPTSGSYTPNPSFGSLTVKGANLIITLKFTTPTVLGLSPAEGFAVISIGLTLGLLFVGIIVLLFRQRRIRRQRQRSEPPQAPPAPPSNSTGTVSSTSPPSPPPAEPPL